MRRGSTYVVQPSGKLHWKYSTLIGLLHFQNYTIVNGLHNQCLSPEGFVTRLDGDVVYTQCANTPDGAYKRPESYQRHTVFMANVHPSVGLEKSLKEFKKSEFIASEQNSTLPDWMQSIGHFRPSGWMQKLRTISAEKADATSHRNDTLHRRQQPSGPSVTFVDQEWVAYTGPGVRESKKCIKWVNNHTTGDKEVLKPTCQGWLTGESLTVRHIRHPHNVLHADFRPSHHSATSSTQLESREIAKMDGVSRPTVPRSTLFAGL